MGQKINPNIFRIGINKIWNTDFFGNKSSELALYTFKNIEIKDYIRKFLKDNELILHSYKLHYNKSLLNIYISYFIPANYKFKKTKTGLQTKNIVNDKLLISKFIEGLNLFTNNKYKIVIVLNCVNKNIKFLNRNHINFLKKRLILLGKFKTKDGYDFDETFDLLFTSVLNKNSSDMLSHFIAISLKKLKKHNRFLACIKRIFTLLIDSDFSTIKGIKIKISGRINRSRRTRSKMIKIGSIPTQTIKFPISYSQSTITHNPNGSYGVKVWIVEKIDII